MSDKHKVTLEYQAKQSREIKRLKAELSRVRSQLNELMKCVCLLTYKSGPWMSAACSDDKTCAECKEAFSETLESIPQRFFEIHEVTP